MHNLSLDAQITRSRVLNDWFKSPQGLDIAEFFTFELNHLNGFLYGQTLLQLGSCGRNSWLQALHFSHKWIISSYLNPLTTFIGSYNHLPIDKASIDCIIAPLVLEHFELAKSPIDEIDRILKPMGYVVFFGINPLSLWGLSLRLQGLSCFGPLKAKAKSIFSVQRAMIHRGYVQSYLSSFYYIPPVSTEKWLSKLEILNELGKMISPCPSGFYCLIMQKQQEINPNLLLTNKEELWKRTVYQPDCFVKKT